MKGSVLVVGGGVAGIQAALDLAEGGFRVYLVEKSPSVGGVMAQLDKTFPTNDCAMCILSPKLVETGRHRNIEIITNAEVVSFDGEPGAFRAIIRRKIPCVDAGKCTACGKCASGCPVEVASGFEEGLVPRKAIYIPFPQAVPLTYTIDRKACIGCGRCKTACRAGAIEFVAAEYEERTIEVGAAVLAPGFEKFDPTRLKEFGYGTYPNVITSIELERMLSASGPTGGHLLRPSDGKIPEKIAFIQCVGSRFGAPEERYCSAVCCMLSVKEALIAQEHTPGLKSTIFFMDLRAFGKDFDEYYTRAEKEQGVRFIMWRMSHVNADPATGKLRLVYETRDGRLEKEDFDIVVLAAGIRPPADTAGISKVFGIGLNGYGFCRTGTFTPTETSRKGVFVAGAFSVPQDVPDSVANASGAAACASAVLAQSRGTENLDRVYPPERDVSSEPPRIGVFVCRCGVNISGTVDVPSVVKGISGEKCVVYVEENTYTCAQDTLRKITDMIKEHGLNRVVVASCTPRTHAPLFQNTLREAGLNPYLFEMANIREQCSWVHMHEKEAATRKATDLVRMAVARARTIGPLERLKVPVTKSALVIGGGISGLTAAAGIAAQGYPVTLVEREKELGGLTRRIHRTLEGSDVQIHLAILVDEVNSNKLVRVLTGATVRAVGGFVGNFKTTVDLGGGKEETVEHGVIIVATGGQQYRPVEHLYGTHPGVMTQLEFEDANARGTLPLFKTVVMVQCVGSRNRKRTYCSRICCTETVKNALRIKTEHKDSQVYILYRDMRTYGFREDRFSEARDLGVNFIRFEDDEEPVVEAVDGKLTVTVRDPVINRRIRLWPDIVTLAAATLPADGAGELAKLLKVPLNRNGFFLEAHVKLRPLDFATDGIFLCGLAHSPKFIEECICQAQGAVARACTLLSKDRLESEGAVAVVDEEKCRACGNCEDACDFRAPEIAVRESGRPASRINPALCKGCGKCVALCCNGAITVRNAGTEQIMEVVRVALCDDNADVSGGKGAKNPAGDGAMGGDAKK